MKLDKIMQASLLYDFYGQLLTKRQTEVMELYYEENLSLAEIADEFEISRQAVSDSLKNAVKSLNEYESKLGLVEKLQTTHQAVSKIDNIIDEIIATVESDKQMSVDDIVLQLRTIKDITDKLED